MENTYTYSPLDRVIWDTPAADAILNEVDRLSAKKVYIVASSTLSKKTDEILKIKNVLGDSFVGLFDSCIQHSPLENVIDCVKSVKKEILILSLLSEVELRLIQLKLFNYVIL